MTSCRVSLAPNDPYSNNHNCGDSIDRPTVQRACAYDVNVSTFGYTYEFTVDDCVIKYIFLFFQRHHAIKNLVVMVQSMAPSLRLTILRPTRRTRIATTNSLEEERRECG